MRGVRGVGMLVVVGADEGVDRARVADNAIDSTKGADGSLFARDVAILEKSYLGSGASGRHEQPSTPFTSTPRPPLSTD